LENVYPDPRTLKIKIPSFGLKTLFFATLTHVGLQTAVELALLAEKTFHIVDVGEKILLSARKPVHRKCLAIGVSWVT
jgi:hypothetical protein